MTADVPEPATPIEVVPIAQAIGRVQAAVKAVPKDKQSGAAGKGGGDKYQYRGIDGALNALHPALSDHGVFILPQVELLEVEPWPHYSSDAWRLYRVTVRYLITGPDGDSVSVLIVGEGLDNGDKGIGKAMSYAYKTMAWQVFSIMTDAAEDTESEGREQPSSRGARYNGGTVPPVPRQRPAAAPPAGPAEPEVEALREALRAGQLGGEWKDSGWPKAAELVPAQFPQAWAWVAGQLNIAPHPVESDDDPTVCEVCGVSPLARWHIASSPVEEPAHPPVSPVPDRPEPPPSSVPDAPVPAPA